jgi:hypothetical protein
MISNHTKPDWNQSGVYSTNLFADKIVNIIEEHRKGISHVTLFLHYIAIYH